MPRPNLKMIEPGRGHGAGSGEAAEEGNLGKQINPHCPTIAQRRADSIRKQALGQIGGAL